MSTRIPKSRKGRGERPRQIDWQNLRERLSRIGEAAEGTLRLSQEKSQALLKERARALAQSAEEPEHTGEVLDVLLLQLGEERYAVEMRYLRQVVSHPECTSVPGGSRLLLG